MSERMTADELRDRQEGGDRDNRRVAGARSVVVDGVRFASRKEARRWAQLRLLEQAGEIVDLRRQVPIGLEGRDGPILTDSGARQRSYVADFRYWDVALGAWVIEDAKSGDFSTEVYRLKRSILNAQGIEILET